MGMTWRRKLRACSSNSYIWTEWGTWCSPSRSLEIKLSMLISPSAMLLVFTDRPETDWSKSWSPSKLLSPQKSFFYFFSDQWSISQQVWDTQSQILHFALLFCCTNLQVGVRVSARARKRAEREKRVSTEVVSNEASFRARKRSARVTFFRSSALFRTSLTPLDPTHPCLRAANRPRRLWNAFSRSSNSRSSLRFWLVSHTNIFVSPAI